MVEQVKEADPVEAQNNVQQNNLSTEDAGANQDQEKGNDRARMQMQYLESENMNLVMENEDLNATLRINKAIIKNLLEDDKMFDKQVEYTMAQINQENEIWESRVKVLGE